MASILSAGTSSGTALNLSGDTSGILQLASNNGTTAVTIDTSQGVGIGTTLTSGLRLSVDSGSVGINTNFNSTNANGVYIRFQNSGTSIGDIGAGGQIVSGGTAGDFGLTSRSGNLVFGTSSTERMRIDSSGNLLVGTTSNPNTTRLIIDSAGNSNTTFSTSVSTSINQCLFRNPNGNVGSIVTNGSTTAYNTTSDYRLKENVAPMTGALAKVQALKPVTYTWKATGKESQGFIAHELAEIVPDCVTGEKDAVNEDGSIKAQGIDTSFLVATLTAAIQELNAKFEEYKASHP